MKPKSSCQISKLAVTTMHRCHLSATLLVIWPLLLYETVIFLNMVIMQYCLVHWYKVQSALPTKCIPYKFSPVVTLSLEILLLIIFPFPPLFTTLFYSVLYCVLSDAFNWAPCVCLFVLCPSVCVTCLAQTNPHCPSWQDRKKWLLWSVCKGNNIGLF